MPLVDFPEYDPAKYPFPPLHDEANHIDQWDGAYHLLMGAEEVGALDMPPRPLTPEIQPGQPVEGIESVPKIDALNPVRCNVMAEQLWLLGYLKHKPRPKDKGKFQSNPAFISAVKRFQNEAELTVDGWIGNQTWRALEAMVGYESETRITHWLRNDGIFNRAFRRAVQLRMWSYGLAEKKPGIDFNTIPEGNILRLKKVLWSLSLIDDYQASISRQALFTILFDSDRLVESAARFKPKTPATSENIDAFSDNALDAAEHKGVTALKRRFLVNLAKVELWLLGSDIKINGKDDYTVAGLPNKRLRKKWGGPHSKPITADVIDKKVRKYLRQYWRTLEELSKKKAARKAKTIAPSLFISLQKQDVSEPGQPTTFKEPDYSQQIAADFEQSPDTETLIKKSYLDSKNLGMKLWDGLKRLWRWVKRGVKKIVTFAKNAFRAFYRFALKGFVIVRTAFTAFARSFDQYFSGRITSKKNPSVTVTIDKDMDNRIMIGRRVEHQDIMNACTDVTRFGAMFFFSCMIVNLFIDILQTAARGLTGWFRLMMSLVKGYRRLVPAYRQLAAVF